MIWLVMVWLLSSPSCWDAEPTDPQSCWVIFPRPAPPAPPTPEPPASEI
jgi:hypothetical protein